MSKKDQILETALNLFNTHNYSTIGIDRIIEESKVAKMTFYKYFPSKEKLIYECLLVRSSGLKDIILSELQTQELPLVKLEKIYNWHLEWFKSEDFYGCMFQKAVMDILVKYPSVIEPVNNYRKWLHEILSDIFLEMKISSSYLVNIFIFILDGMIIQNKIETSTNNSNWDYILNLINFELEN
ncbi:TetR/AcrR family transcriptional regulator [Acinetobacter soli]|uniref:TetR/AcrR family transcriptional regulator n=1 Tax=Acinetobacter soli TaxID=487316 RepID=UPI001C0B88E9|nr:TetR/AcrR family transcriptional regulator [Acinetobacter soli]MBU3121336.1 TetR/AcrR family transcriptional regulator [Acinetobacter soli]